MKTVVVAMSGGVDSSVSAYMLKQRGFKVIGLFMKNWEDDDQGSCTAASDWEDVLRVADSIGIPAYSVNFAKEYKEHVFSDFLFQLENGCTPNPDILCNREIKFKYLMDKALELGADFLATGHYCQKGTAQGKSTLLKGADPNKDQSYFLHALAHTVLDKVLFPIGNIHKGTLRQIARDQGLATSEKKDSTGICFIGKRDFKPFVQQYLAPKVGSFCRLDGTVVGSHDGAVYYTIGQRRGIGLGGPGEPWFVVGKDIGRNIVYVEQGINHPALFSNSLIAKHLTWIAGEPPAESCKSNLTAKIRYRQSDQECQFEYLDDDTIQVSFREPQRAVTPGQSIVFYDQDICLGGGIIIPTTYF